MEIGTFISPSLSPVPWVGRFVLSGREMWSLFFKLAFHVNMSGASDECTIYLKNTEWQKILEKGIRSLPLLWTCALCLHVIWKLGFKVTSLFLLQFLYSLAWWWSVSELYLLTWIVLWILFSVLFSRFSKEMIFSLLQEKSTHTSSVYYMRKKEGTVAIDSPKKFFLSMPGVF